MRPSRLLRTFCLLSLTCTLTAATACGKNNADNNTSSNSTTKPAKPALPAQAPALLSEQGELRLQLVLPPKYEEGLSLAAEDLKQVVSALTGVDTLSVTTEFPDDPDALVIWVDVLPEPDETLGEQGYLIKPASFEKQVGLHLFANNQVAGMYALYDLLGHMGARYHHPEESHMPAPNAEAVLPWDFDGSSEQPTFELRGFHEHTQHPTPMSDYYLRPEPEFRPYVSRYMRWMARNRQNAASFHMLKTVDLEAWSPYIKDVVNEAHGLGIRVGMVTSFLDEQQNNFKIITPERLGDDGEVMPDEQQITQVLTQLHGLGFDFFTFQIGSSEFTKPEDDRVVRWLDHSAELARSLSPELDLFTWIHTTCSLEDDDGGYFYHLPSKADADIGTWVHTVMFHTLEHPAPVYDCENFHQQREFLKQEDGKRKQVYFPETAWWLGFDNNMPLALPLTGYTRAWDIQKELKPYDVYGHITFTTGREWGYWQYDHYLMQATWDRGVGWEDYLDWISPMYGAQGEQVTSTLKSWTQQQATDILETNPLIYFYLAGELQQDEIGAKAGILARRPKLPYQEVAAYDDTAFAAWKTRDFDMLVEMRDRYAGLLGGFERPDVPGAAAALDEVLTYEIWAGLYLHVKRIEQAIALYSGVIEARTWIALYGADTAYDDPRRAMQRTKAEEHLLSARAITQEAAQIILSMEAHYRYPDEILNQPKPETLTSYPFGYLEQAHTAHFWTRRDDQLESFIQDAFSEDKDAWIQEPALLFAAKGRQIKMVEPDNAVAGGVISSFIPQMLFGLDGDLSAESAAGTLVLGQDANTNFKPDEGTEDTFTLQMGESQATGSGDSYTFIVRNNMNQVIGSGLELLEPLFELKLERDPNGLVTMTEGDLSGDVRSADLLGLIQEVGGIDDEGATGLLKSVFGVEADQPLPELLSIRFRMRVSPVP